MKSQTAASLIAMLAASFLGGGVVSIAFIGNQQSVQGLVRAQSFELVDPSGTALAILSTTHAGLPCLSLYDKTGRLRWSQWLKPDGAPHMAFYDNNSQGLLSLGENDDGFSIVMLGHAKEPRLVLSVANKEPQIDLFDRDGKWRAVLGVYDYEPYLSFKDIEEKSQAYFGVADGLPVLTFTGRDGTARAFLGVTAEDSACLSFLDSDGNIRSAMWGNAKGQAAFELRDEQNNKVWLAPHSTDLP